MHVCLSSCTVSVKINFLLTSLTPDYYQDKSRINSSSPRMQNMENKDCQNRRGTDTRCLDENAETDAQIRHGLIS